MPEHVVLPRELTGVDARDRRRARRPLPDDRARTRCSPPTAASRRASSPASSTRPRHRAVWPSTGNYCRGGVAISRLMGCRGVAVLPEGMSQERFDWLERWVADPRGHHPHARHREQRQGDLRQVRTSSRRDPENVIFNQFSEFGNHLVHYLAHRRARSSASSRRCSAHEPALRLRAFVSATGSAGTIAAGDYLKERYGSLIVAVEALECPTMLYNGFGEHNIQGIGDKHIPLIHNVHEHRRRGRASPTARPTGSTCCSTPTRAASYLAGRRGVAADVVAQLPSLGLSSICNVLARDQDGEVLRPRPGRRRSSRSPPTARRCTAASAEHRAREVLPRRVRRGRRRRGLRRAPARRRRPTTCSS